VSLNPLSELTDAQLFDTQVTLALACGRAKAAIKGKHKALICTLNLALKQEADNRGRPSPSPPYSA